MSKKICLNDIIAKKHKGQMDRLAIKYYHSQVLDGDIEIRKIPLQEYIDLVSKIDDENSIDGMNQIIYACCPMFKENTKEAMEIYEVVEPTDLPSAVLEDQLNELTEIVEAINGFYGLDKIKGTVKN